MSRVVDESGHVVHACVCVCVKGVGCRRSGQVGLGMGLCECSRRTCVMTCVKRTTQAGVALRGVCLPVPAWLDLYCDGCGTGWDKGVDAYSV